ncbi:MAG: hypothetical protein ACJZ9F_08070, partial [Rhodospirillaceae bacterium]
MTDLYPQRFDPMLSSLSRRSLLGGLGASGLFSASPTFGAVDPSGLDFSQKSHRMQALIKMRASMDNRIVMGGVQGLYYGVVNNKIAPLYGVLAGT